MILPLILIHVAELIIFFVGFVIYKALKLQKIVQQQQTQLQSISDIVSFSQTKLDEIDSKGSFRSDDEVGFFFEGLKEIQNTLNVYTNG